VFELLAAQIDRISVRYVYCSGNFRRFICYPRLFPSHEATTLPCEGRGGSAGLLSLPDILVLFQWFECFVHREHIGGYDLRTQ